MVQGINANVYELIVVMERIQLASIIHELLEVDLHRYLVGSIRIKTFLVIFLSS